MVALRKESVDRNSCYLDNIEITEASLSARRAWIEIVIRTLTGCVYMVALRKESVDRNLVRVGFLTTLGGSLSARRAWIEIQWIKSMYPGCRSLSARRAWIEMLSRDADGAYLVVALRKESVDRNSTRNQPSKSRCLVALRKESVDRNSRGMNTILFITVALRKESVDRNRMGVTVLGIQHRSLSARRAWIEI